MSGGKDGVAVLWDEMFSQPLRAFQIETSKFPPGTILLHEHPPIRSIHTDEGKILVGTGHDDIIEIHADGSMEVILQVMLFLIITNDIFGCERSRVDKEILFKSLSYANIVANAAIIWFLIKSLGTCKDLQANDS